MAEILYVDWDGLIYYDGKVKDYIEDKIKECLKFRGDVTYEELLQISPSYDNVNTAFRITEEFTTNDWFKNPGYGYSAYTVVFITQLEDGTFKYDILLEPNGSGNGTDLTNYYTKEDVDEIVSELPTKEFVERTVIDAIDSIEIDVSGLVAREELELLETKEDAQKKYEDAIAYTDDKFNTLLGDDVDEAYNSFKEIQDLMKADDGVTAALLSDVETVKVTVADAVTHVDQLNDQLGLVNDKVDLVNSLKADKTELPTRVSDLLNDVGYLTEHQDISHLATKDDVAEAKEQSASNEVKIMMLDEEIIDINQRIDAIPGVDLTGYATEDYVNEKIAEALGGEVELDNYYTKEEVDALIPDVSNFATKEELPTLEGYATEEWVQNQNYLTEHIDISGKADVSELNALGDRVTEVSNAVDGKADASHTHSLSEIVDYEAPDLSTLATKEEIADFATEQYVADRISEIVIPDVSNFITEIPDEYVTADELAAEGFIKEHQSLEEYAKKTDIPSLNGYATEQYVENAISNIDFPDIDTSTLATKEELAAAVSNKANDILFTEDYRVGTPLGQFVADETVQNMTLSQIIVKLLELTAYIPPTTDLPEGTTTTVEDIIVQEVPIMILGNNGEPSSSGFEYKTMTTDEGALDSQDTSFMYQIVDADNKVVESGYQTVTEELDEGYLTVYLPTSVTAFSVRIFDGISGAWVTPEWQMLENTDYNLDGYIAYTADPAYDIYEKMTIRIVIEN